MTEEQKQALIEHCQLRIKVLQTFWHPGEEDMTAAKSDLKAHEIALAALTAQPVKLAKDLKLSDKAHRSHCDYAEGYNDRAEMDRAAIRAAGYQVEGE